MNLIEMEDDSRRYFEEVEQAMQSQDFMSEYEHWLNKLNQQGEHMNIDEIYSSNKSLKAEDLKGRSVKCKISEVGTVEFDGEKKLEIKFVGKEKTLVMNKTNAKIVAEHYGKDTEKWVGQEIEIYPTKTDYAGKLVDCIRVRVEAPYQPGEDPGF